MSVSNEAVLDALDAIYGRLTFSVAQYAIDSDPYVTDDDKKTVALMKEIAAADASELSECSRLIEQADGIPQAGAPNSRLPEMNYLSYPHLLDIIIEELAEESELFSKAAARLSGTGEDEVFARRIAAARAEQLKKLQDLRTSAYPSDSAAPAEAAPAA